MNSCDIKFYIIYLIYKLRRKAKAYTPREKDGEGFYTVKFYLGKWLWSIQYCFAGNAYFSIVVYSIFGFLVDSEAQPQNCFEA